MKIGVTEEDFLRDLAESDVALLQEAITESMGHAMARIIAETGRTRWIYWGYSGINLLAPFRSIGAQLVVTTSKGFCSFMIAVGGLGRELLFSLRQIDMAAGLLRPRPLIRNQGLTNRAPDRACHP